MKTKKILFLLNIILLFCSTIKLCAIDFSVASANVLYDLSYLKYFYGNQPVSIQQRIESFNNLMQNLKS